MKRIGLHFLVVAILPLAGCASAACEGAYDYNGCVNAYNARVLRGLQGANAAMQTYNQTLEQSRQRQQYQYEQAQRDQEEQDREKRLRDYEKRLKALEWERTVNGMYKY